MRNHILLTALLSFAVPPAIADDATKKKVEPDGEELLEIWLYPPRENGWFVRFLADGSVQAQYGSGLGDGANLPKGTVKLPALLKACERLRSDKRIEGASQVSISRRDSTESESCCLKDDTLFRYLMDSFEGSWRQEPGIKRFLELRRKYPIFEDKPVAKDTANERRRQHRAKRR